ncbi:MAG: hypothetical protein KC442_11065 [Thermomicrobiales bacterium]|nr:hypothetical protein [Thermomicrobiales bacterium]
MTLPIWREEPITGPHRRQDFDCGDADLNLYLQRYARQSHEQNAAKTCCAIDDAVPGRILGVYTITPSAVAHEVVPSTMTRGLARHEVSGFRLARLAVDQTVAEQGLGGQLLAAAALRCLRVANEAGGVLLIIDAKGGRSNLVRQLRRRATGESTPDLGHAPTDVRRRSQEERASLAPLRLE